MKVYELVTAL